MAAVKKGELQRLRAAEETCFALLLAIALGGVDIDQQWRVYLSENGLDDWMERAVEAGLVREGAN